MKTNLLSRAALLVVSLFAIKMIAAPLASTTAVHTKPDETAPTFTFLKAGDSPMPAAETKANTPAGWMAVEIDGPFEGYIQDKDVTKELDMKPGISIYLAPKADAAVLTTALKTDKTTITGQHGRWLQVKLERKLTGYINVGGAPGYMPPIATTPAGTTPAPIAPAPVAPVAYGTATPGQAAPVVSPNGSAGELARQFVGKLASTRRPLRPRRPYDWELEDDAGKRFAYLDVSRLLLTQQLEALENHAVIVFGAPRASADGKDLVIDAETLQLK